MTSLLTRSARRQPAHSRVPVEPSAPLPDDRTNAAMDDAREAERLMEDLLALVDVGLVVAQDSQEGLRYAPADGALW